MKRLLVALFVLFIMMLISCTQQQRAKKYGGSAIVKLPIGTRLLEATWKENDLWYLVRERKSNEKPQTYTFSESSSWGVLQGKIVFHEQ